MTAPAEELFAAIGDEIFVTVPSWSVAGYFWEPEYDQGALLLVGSDTRFGSASVMDKTQKVFRFQVLRTDCTLRLRLRRPGKPPRETRCYVITSKA